MQHSFPKYVLVIVELVGKAELVVVTTVVEVITMMVVTVRMVACVY